MGFIKKFLDRKLLVDYIVGMVLMLFLFILIFKFFLDPAGPALPEADYYLKPDGGMTIQQALDAALPGQVIYLMPGVYYQDVLSVRDGTKNSPIEILGTKSAIVKGAGNGRIFDIKNNYIILNGFTIDGLFGHPDQEKGYRDELLYVTGGSGLKIMNMDLKNSGGECFRLKYFSHDNEVSYNNISNCGIFDFKFNAGGKNGEGIYIGTAPEQLDRNPTQEIDKSNDNYIHDNLIDTQGSEGVDIKEGSSGNIVEANSITGQMDPESGGLGARGNENVFRYNQVYGCEGAGIRLGGDKFEGIKYGKDNQVYENKFYSNKFGPMKIQVLPQGKICGNEIYGNGPQLGDFGSQIEMTSPCN